MKRILLLCIIFGWIFLLPAQAKEKNQTLSLSGLPDQKGRTISVKYNNSSQASIATLYASYQKRQATNLLILKGTLRNRSSRDLIKAMITAECSDSDNSFTKKGESPVYPIKIKKNKRNGHFEIEIEYSPQINTCQLEISWQGKEEDR